MSDATASSGKRHDVPEDIRQKAHELKATMDRYASAMGHHWVADEVSLPTSGLLIKIARDALILHYRHAAWAMECLSPIPEKPNVP